MYVMSEDDILLKEDTNNTRKTEPRYAGFWMRLCAYVIDTIVIFSISGFFTSPLSLIDGSSNLSIFGFWSTAAVISTLVYYSYFLIMTKLLGQTLVNMILNSTVIPKKNHNLSWIDLLSSEVTGLLIKQPIFLMK